MIQYGAAHEHKGPADFNGGGNLDDDEDDEMGTPPIDDHAPPDHNLPPHLQHQAGYAHMRHAPSASPPMSNGVPFHNRQQTPQAQMQMGSRPGSRNAVARPPSNLGPSQLSQAPQVQNGYAYVPNPSFYNPHAAQGMPSAPPHGLPTHRPNGMPGPGSYPGPPQRHAANGPMQQPYIQEPRRQSMPPTFPQQEQARQQQQQQHLQPNPSLPQPERIYEEDNQLSAPKPIPAKSRSIFTPIDDSRSLLAQHWSVGDRKDIKIEKDSRSQSVDIGSVQQQMSTRQNQEIAKPNSKPTQPSPPSAKPQKAQASRVNHAPEFQPPSRTNSAPTGAKRPRLKVQIPSEHSEDEGDASAASSTRQSGQSATPAKASTDASHSSGVVLPPPSPSASAILSAGAQGPPNPFARPHPPNHAANSNNQSYSSNNNIETPISALPSRFVADGLLPSPSSFYPEWGFGRAGGDSNMLPSPLNFQTPVMGNGPSFLRDEEPDRKRKSPEGDAPDSNAKRVKA